MSRTNIYIDGYNLYYSRLQRSAFKWLDLVALFRDQILAVQDPTATVATVKFFTAPVKANFARHGEASEQAQEQYHRALRATYPDLVEIVQGFHIFRPTSLPAHIEGRPPSKTDRVRAWMIEEKLTDVNLALHVYRDAVQGVAQQLVICSNDSDLEPALQFVRRDMPSVKIGLIMPLREGAKGQGMISNKRLLAQADWVRHHILDDELARSQFPAHVQTRKKPASNQRIGEDSAEAHSRTLGERLDGSGASNGAGSGLQAGPPARDPSNGWHSRRRQKSQMTPCYLNAALQRGVAGVSETSSAPKRMPT